MGRCVFEYSNSGDSHSPQRYSKKQGLSVPDKKVQRRKKKGGGLLKQLKV